MPPRISPRSRRRSGLSEHNSGSELMSSLGSKSIAIYRHSPPACAKCRALRSLDTGGLWQKKILKGAFWENWNHIVVVGLKKCQINPDKTWMNRSQEVKVSKFFLRFPSPAFTFTLPPFFPQSPFSESNLCHERSELCFQQDDLR